MWGSPGFPRRRPLTREGVNSGQMENAGDGILGQEWIGRAQRLGRAWGRETLLAAGVCGVGWAWVSCPVCWAQYFQLEHGN